jgi:hypothetical protein
MTGRGWRGSLRWHAKANIRMINSLAGNNLGIQPMESQGCHDVFQSPLLGLATGPGGSAPKKRENRWCPCRGARAARPSQTIVDLIRWGMEEILRCMWRALSLGRFASGGKRQCPCKKSIGAFMNFDIQWLRQSLSRFLREYKRRTHENQGTLARRAGVSEGAIRDFIGGRNPTANGPQWGTLVKLAAAAGTNAFEMLRSAAPPDEQAIKLELEAIEQILALGCAAASES